MNGKEYAMRPGRTIRSLAHGVEEYLTREERLRCDVLRTETGAYIVQARDRHQELIRWAGLGREVSVRFDPAPGNRVRVSVTPGTPVITLLLLTAGLFLFWGIAATSLVGLCRQALMIWRLRRAIRQMMEGEE